MNQKDVERAIATLSNLWRVKNTTMNPNIVEDIQIAIACMRMCIGLEVSKDEQERR